MKRQLNRYIKFSKLSEAKTREILRYFALDLTASDASRLSGVSVRSVNDLYLDLRCRIYAETARASPLAGAIEVDESYFGPKRVRGKRGRGAGGKTIVFGLLKRGDSVYTEIVPDVTKATLQKIIRGKAELSSVIHSDGWPGYHGLVDLGYDKHFRVDHSANEFARGEHHVNGIESFWSYAKARMQKFKGVRRYLFPLHLRETEWRFNLRKRDIYKHLLAELRQNPL